MSDKELTFEEFCEQYVKPAAESLFIRYMHGSTDELDQRMLASMGYGPHFDGFKEPTITRPEDGKA